ncbi:MAG TPA: cytochrome C oxidase subunit IV family protein [Thermoanaerobaculia bacterium]|jgi:cytochrome c oxidase subunit 4
MSGHHVVPVRLYVAVFMSLMAFTTITVAVAYLDLGALNNVVMLGIAVTKATLVILYFMHVRYATRMIPVVLVAAVLWLLILFGFIMSDYVTRGWLGAGAPWPAPWSH